MNKVNFPIVGDWHGLYREKWKSYASDLSHTHPAKFSRALIREVR